MRPWLLPARSRVCLASTGVWRLSLSCSTSFAGSGNEQGRLGLVGSVADNTAGTILIHSKARLATSVAAMRTAGSWQA